MCTVLLFPGAGSGFSAPFAHYPRGHEIAADVAKEIDEVSAAYGCPSVLAASDPGDSPFVDELRTFHIQLSCLRILSDELELAADFVVGHSLGEITALVVAGGLTVGDGTRLLCERARALLAHAEPSGMSVAFMLSPARATAFASQVGDVVVAAVNSPSQVILSGPVEQLRSLMARADRRGIQATPLRVGRYPQHHPGLASAFDRYVDSVRDIRQRPPRLAVYSPVLGRRLGPEDDLVRVATLQMVRPLDFLRATTDLHEAGADRFVECGLKDTLTRLVAETLGERAQVWAPFRRRVTTDDIQRMKSTFVGANVVPEHDTLMTELRTLYASALEVPAELVTPDVDLEAEFGLDSLQHRLVITAAAERWQIRLGEDPLPATLTLRVVADMISAAGSRPRG